MLFALCPFRIAFVDGDDKDLVIFFTHPEYDGPDRPDESTVKDHLPVVLEMLAGRFKLLLGGACRAFQVRHQAGQKEIQLCPHVEGEGETVMTERYALDVALLLVRHASFHHHREQRMFLQIGVHFPAVFVLGFGEPVIGTYNLQPDQIQGVRLGYDRIEQRPHPVRFIQINPRIWNDPQLTAEG